MSIKVGFDVKFGHNEIELPINTGEKVYHDNAPAGLSDLNDCVFTIINQIPKSADNPQAAAWVVHKIEHCGKKNGLYDKSSGQTFYRTGTWTAYIHSWQNYKPPTWLSDGYYALSDDEKAEYFTINTGDLIIFGDAPDDVPKTMAEFQSMVTKYRNYGGTVTGSEVYIKYKPNGQPWKTNHIEVIKA